jgi:hypothetical protein
MPENQSNNHWNNKQWACFVPRREKSLAAGGMGQRMARITGRGWELPAVEGRLFMPGSQGARQVRAFVYFVEGYGEADGMYFQ